MESVVGLMESVLREQFGIDNQDVIDYLIRKNAVGRFRFLLEGKRYLSVEDLGDGHGLRLVALCTLPEERAERQEKAVVEFKEKGILARIVKQMLEICDG